MSCTFKVGDKVRVRPFKSVYDLDSDSMTVLLKQKKIDLRKVYTINHIHVDSRNLLYLNGFDIGIFHDCFVLEE